MKNKNYSLLGILGNPLSQSMSPLIHNFWIKQYNLDGFYCKFQLSNITSINKSIKKLNIKGVNVTIPFKKKIIKFLDKIDVLAEALQAVNTVDNKNGILKGYNTDVNGFLEGLKNFRNIDKSKHAIIFGAGGACEAIIHSLKLYGFKKIYLINRTKKKALSIASKYNFVEARNWVQEELVYHSEIIVNSTSLGMIGYPVLPIDLKNAKNDIKIYDIVYNPIETDLIKQAKKNKLQYTTGLPMFLGQARESFKIWFKIKPNVSDYLISKIRKNINYK